MYSLPVSKIAAQIMGELCVQSVTGSPKIAPFMAKNTLVPCLTPSFDRKKRKNSLDATIPNKELKTGRIIYVVIKSENCMPNTLLHTAATILLMND